MLIRKWSIKLCSLIVQYSGHQNFLFCSFQLYPKISVPIDRILDEAWLLYSSNITWSSVYMQNTICTNINESLKMTFISKKSHWCVSHFFSSLIWLAQSVSVIQSAEENITIINVSMRFFSKWKQLPKQNSEWPNIRRSSEYERFVWFRCQPFEW